MRRTILFVIIALLPIQFSIFRYNYSFYGNVLHSAPGMYYQTHFNEQMLGVPLQSPEDIVVYEDLIYIICSGSNNLVIVNNRFEQQASYTEFTFTDEYQNSDKVIPIPIPNSDQVVIPTSLTLNKPQGIEVKDTGIYIADTENKRIVKLNHEFKVVDTFSEVEDQTFETVEFKPTKITVDTTGRMYVVALNILEGIIELDVDGSFNRYTGVNPIKLTPLEIFRRALMTEAQIAQLKRFLPTEYTNVSMTSENFIYATSKPSSAEEATNMIQLINPKGKDVLRKNGFQPPMGDIQYVISMDNYVINGPSSLVDIATTRAGIYTVLDQKRSRLFTYDSEGNLLFINGDEGAQSDKFTEGVAIAYFNDDLLVVDRRTRTIIVYQLTQFGEYVVKATEHYVNGEFDLAADIWREVLVLNTNYEVAYSGIGKHYLRLNDYKEAMGYFKQGHDRYYYSKAFKGYRNEIIKENFGFIFLGLLALGAGVIVYSVHKKKKGVIKADES